KDLVEAHSARDLVAATDTHEEGVVACTAVEEVLARSAGDHVVACAAGDGVVSGAAVDLRDVEQFRGAEIKGVVEVGSDDDVRPGTAVDALQTRRREQLQEPDRVVSGAAQQLVETVATGDLVGPAAGDE